MNRSLGEYLGGSCCDKETNTTYSIILYAKVANMVEHYLLKIANERSKVQETKSYCFQKDHNFVGKTCVLVGVQYAIDSTGTLDNQGGCWK